MRALLVPLLMLCLFSLVSSQMTFSDHWSKKNFPSRPSEENPLSEQNNLCKDEAFYEMKVEWLRSEMQKTQRQLAKCRRT